MYTDCVCGERKEGPTRTACVRDVAVVSATSGERAHVCVLPEDRTALQPSCALRKESAQSDEVNCGIRVDGDY